ncbi:MAG: FGGY-family carbohydrate kinase [Lachnospiraceae bacterium]|nr:FGGY-family carbohydrate kinase [Lachnospiraceae bacterium]
MATKNTYIIAYDLGTGGIKTSLFDEKGKKIKSVFGQCETLYPQMDFREQKPSDWWELVVRSTKDLLSSVDVEPNDIAALACSGHSLGVVPLSSDGELLLTQVPIWTDARAAKLSEQVFSNMTEEEWYLKTGNGFPAHLYSAFKILWYKRNMPDIYDKTYKFIGTKDFLNFKLTGVIATDHSYATGSGVYDLEALDYDKKLIETFGLEKEKFPYLLESSQLIGKILPRAAKELGLGENVMVAAGGVDNACMSAGAGCVEEGMAYTSLGTSAWVAVTSRKPVLNDKTRPYVFGHLIKGMYVSAESIFSAGNTYRWVRDTLCQDIKSKEDEGGENAYVVMDRLAMESPIGSNGLIFVPTLAGGNALDDSVDAKGAITGLDLKHSRADIIRCALEGICFGLKNALEVLRRYVTIADEILIVGGGAKSAYWRQMFADVYNVTITESAVQEDAGSLGAFACAAIGIGIWKDFSPLKEINHPISEVKPQSENVKLYESLFKVFMHVNALQSEIAEFAKSVKTDEVKAEQQ